MFHPRLFPVARVALVNYLLDNLAPLRKAANLLGGSDAAKRVSALAQEVSEPVPLSPRLGRALEWLEGLLTLDRVYDADTVEAERFALIDPCDPIVAEICALTDGYTDALTALRLEAPEVFRWRAEAA